VNVIYAEISFIDLDSEK